MYSVCIRIDETLPWIELEGAFQTREEAKKAAERMRNNIQVRINSTPEEKKTIKVLATIRR